MRTGERIFTRSGRSTLARGLTRKDDLPAKAVAYGSQRDDIGPVSPEGMERMLTEYYRLRGGTPTGRHQGAPEGTALKQAAEKGPSASLARSGAHCGVPGVRLARPRVPIRRKWVTPPLHLDLFEQPGQEHVFQ